MNGEMEEADYEAQCQAEAEAEGQAMDEMAAQAENEAEQHNEEIRVQEEFIKEHLGLKGKECIWKHKIRVKDYPEKLKVADISDVSMEILKDDIIEVNTYPENVIHKTQIDKENLIDTLEHWLQSEQGLLRQIKEELGL